MMHYLQVCLLSLHIVHGDSRTHTDESDGTSGHDDALGHSQKVGNTTAGRRLLLAATALLVHNGASPSGGTVLFRLAALTGHFIIQRSEGRWTETKQI